MNKVYNNINESPYSIRKKDLIFYFSSEFNLKRFNKGCLEYVNNETSKIISKYHISGNFEKYLLVAYYLKIEKRGFKICDSRNNKLLQHYMMFDIILL